MLSKGNTGLIVVDVQGKLATLMHESDALIENITKLVKGAKALDLPILWLEQNPERLGPTAEPIREVLESTHLPITKYTFDGCKEARHFAGFSKKLDSNVFYVLRRRGGLECFL